MAKIPTITNAIFNINFPVFLTDDSLKIIAAKGGININATNNEAINAKVLVNANGLKSLPSAPTIVNTGIKLTIVVRTAVIIAPETSVVAL